MAVRNAGRTRKLIQSVTGLFNGRFAQYVMPARSSFKSPEDIPSLPTGFRPLDKAVGVGGLPRGQLTELVSPGITSDTSGTICVAARIAAKAQRQQQIVTVIDLSNQFDLWLAERSGLMAPELLLSQPETVFEALTALEEAARSGGLALVVMGVVADLLDHVDAHLLSVLLRRLRTIVQDSDSAFLFVTTPAEDDPFSPGNYPAGFHLAELAALRLWVQDEHWTYKANVATTYKAILTVVQNKLAPVGAGADVRIKFASV